MIAYCIATMLIAADVETMFIASCIATITYCIATKLIALTFK